MGSPVRKGYSKRLHQVAAKLPAAKWRRLGVFAAVFCALGSYWLLSQSSALTPMPPPRMYLTPENSKVRPQSEFVVEVRANSSGVTSNAVQAEITYPDNLLEYQGFHSDGSGYEIDAPSTGGNGKISIVRGSTAGVIGDQLVATLRFRSRTTAGAAPLAFAEGTQLLGRNDNADILGTLNRTAGALIVVDGAEPAVSVTAPAAGALVRGTVAIKATADDGAGGTGVAKVEFFVAGVKIGEDYSSPYEINWDSTIIADGPREIVVKAHDTTSPANVATSAAASVTVDNTAPTAPSGLRVESRTASSVTLAWDASYDAGAVTGYRLQRNNSSTPITLPATARSYTMTGLTPNTGYAFNLVATDAAGNVSVPAVVTAHTTNNKRGDLNGDLTVGILDLSILMSKWGTAHAASDINDDGTVNVADLSILLSNWGAKTN